MLTDYGLSQEPSGKASVDSEHRARSVRSMAEDLRRPTSSVYSTDSCYLSMDEIPEVPALPSLYRNGDSVLLASKTHRPSSIPDYTKVPPRKPVPSAVPARKPVPSAVPAQKPVPSSNFPPRKAIPSAKTLLPRDSIPHREVPLERKPMTSSRLSGRYSIFLSSEHMGANSQSFEQGVTNEKVNEQTAKDKVAVTRPSTPFDSRFAENVCPPISPIQPHAFPFPSQQRAYVPKPAATSQSRTIWRQVKASVSKYAKSFGRVMSSKSNRPNEPWQNKKAPTLHPTSFANKTVDFGSKKSIAREPQHSAQVPVRKPVKVIGRPDRDTMFEDFVAYRSEEDLRFVTPSPLLPPPVPPIPPRHPARVLNRIETSNTALKFRSQRASHQPMGTNPNPQVRSSIDMFAPQSSRGQQWQRTQQRIVIPREQPNLDKPLPPDPRVSYHTCVMGRTLSGDDTPATAIYSPYHRPPTPAPQPMTFQVRDISDFKRENPSTYCPKAYPNPTRQVRSVLSMSSMATVSDLHTSEQNPSLTCRDSPVSSIHSDRDADWESLVVDTFVRENHTSVLITHPFGEERGDGEGVRHARGRSDGHEDEATEVWERLGSLGLDSGRGKGRW